MNKRIHKTISIVLVLLLVLSIFPMGVMATEEEKDTITVYMSVSEDAAYVQTPIGNVAALTKLEVPYFDIGELYDLAEYYFVSESYGPGESSGPGSDLEPGTPEFAYGKITALHMLIYATEVLYYGIDPEDAGKGYLYDEGLMNDAFHLSGSGGSAFMNNFWSEGMNLNYYVNYEYPLASAGWGSTIDQILIEDGDIFTVGIFTDMSFYSDPASVFNYIKVGDEISATATATRGDKITLDLMNAGSSFSGDFGTSQDSIDYIDPIVYCTEADNVTADVTEWDIMENLLTGTEYALNGQFEIDTTDMQPGEYILAVPGNKGDSNTIVATPGGIRLTIKPAQGDDTPPEQPEGPTKDTVTAYFTVSADGNYLGAPQSGDLTILREFEVPYFDIAKYGLEEYYFVSEDYGSDGSGAPSSDLVPGTKEFAEGKITALHLMLYATEILNYGLAPEDAGQGYLYDTGVLDELFGLQGSVGSSYMSNFWGYGENLNYYHNYIYPLASEGWGATSDQVLLNDGDIVHVATFQGYDFFYHEGAGFNFIQIGDEVTAKATVKAGETLELKLMHAFGDILSQDMSTLHTPFTQCPTVYYTADDDLSEDVSTWTELGTANDDGTFILDTTDFNPGEYIVAFQGMPCSYCVENLCNTPGAIRIVVEEDANTPAEPEIIYGDVSGDDGVINSVDAAVVYAIANGKIDPTDAQNSAADVNGDGTVNSIDAAMIYAYANGKMTAFPKAQ